MSRPKFLLIVVPAVICCFFITTFFMNWDLALVEKNLAEADKEVKALAELKSPKIAQTKCPHLIGKLEDGIGQFVEHNKISDQAKSIKLIADCQKLAKDYEGAAESFARLMELEPQAARWHGFIAESLYAAQNNSEALRSVHLATQLDPENYGWHLLKARILRSINKSAQAIEAYQQALAYAPFDAAQQITAEVNTLTDATMLSGTVDQ